MTADKRIPITKERWEQLGELKQAGETYDDLLEKLIQTYHRTELAESIRNADDETYTPLDEI